MMAASWQALQFEPTTEALARAAAARGAGIIDALICAAVTLVLATWARQPAVALLALSALVNAATLAFAPHSPAFLLALLATVLTLPATLILLLAQRARIRVMS
jgi:hypothetical protein